MDTQLFQLSIREASPAHLFPSHPASPGPKAVSFRPPPLQASDGAGQGDGLRVDECPVRSARGSQRALGSPRQTSPLPSLRLPGGFPLPACSSRPSGPCRI